MYLLFFMPLQKMLNIIVKIMEILNFLSTFFWQASVEDSDHQSMQPGALVGSNDVLLTKILIRLPVTSILRFKSVSKHWHWLLSHRRFTLRYDKLTKSPGLLGCNIYIPFDTQNQSTPPPHYSLDFFSDPYGIRILQSCNGLLLCCSEQCGSSARKFYLFNPTTKQFATVPSVPGGHNARRFICFMGVAFHPIDCVHYKIICIRKRKPGEKLFQIQIYSSDTGKWKISFESFSANDPSFDKGVYWNGAIHWAPSYHDHLYFDIEIEQLQTLPLPVEMRSAEMLTMYFGESRGHLHLIVTNSCEFYNLHVNVYEMLNNHLGWFVKYQVELNKLPGAFPEMINRLGYAFEVIDVVRCEKEEDTFMVLRIPGKIITYNVHDKSFKQIFHLTNLLYGGFPKFHRYTEALTSF